MLTYTMFNQQELTRRLAGAKPMPGQVEVGGWFSFLLSYWIRPYLPLRFVNRRLYGLNFSGEPAMYATGPSRFLDSEGRAYKRHLAQLALDTNEASDGASVDRLSRLFDQIYVDEVQDLNGYDLEVLSELFASSIDIYLVGDVRQALLMTNVQDPKNKQYKGLNSPSGFSFNRRRAS